MKAIVKILVLAAATLGLIACNKNEVTTVSTSKTALQVYAGLSTATRAYDTYWVPNDAIGIRATTGDYANSYKNVSYTLDEQSETTLGHFSATGDAIYFTNATDEITFAAYGPYQSSDDVATLPGTNEDGKVSPSTESQSSQDAQMKIDFIYSASDSYVAGESQPVVNFVFKHEMAKLIVYVVNGSGQDLTKIQAGTYTLGGLIHEGTFDVTSGTAEAGTTANAVSDWSLSSNAVKSTPEDGVQYTAIIYPQSFTAETILPFSATVNGESFTIDLPLPSSPSSDEFKAGYSYTYKITLSENSLTLGGDDGSGSETNGCTITMWDPGDTIERTITGGTVEQN